jgi:hypothetical protein
MSPTLKGHGCLPSFEASAENWACILFIHNLTSSSCACVVTARVTREVQAPFVRMDHQLTSERCLILCVAECVTVQARPSVRVCPKEDPFYTYIEQVETKDRY